ncbi:uncharacterized protein STEHIDRAFT_135570 [Stereum hirsutum FP-91666 SS1]|uniref:DRBM domain-containing protein n=1 Tax=Stereum hirsutum (strain FP-91666) TaxID=721885 RepID=R7RX73_STEHR|nr:uncharacterized protein STEHIDRAFT_135570 [Stereum hirsutum FP-91666 SS1]EIM79986.1 hypothetical protein STEHIDRAFT_135570 [Stereum hirsutum FP-91666 SS1]
MPIPQQSPLPELTSNFALAVYTHKSLRQPSSAEEDNERLAMVGRPALQFAVANALFSKEPELDPGEMQRQLDHITSVQTITTWVDAYNMRRNFVPAAKLEDPNQLLLLFHSFVGAVLVTSGIIAVQTWIGKIVDPNYGMSHFSLPPMPPAPPPGSPGMNGPPPGLGGMPGMGMGMGMGGADPTISKSLDQLSVANSYISRLNEMGQKTQRKVEWNAGSSGPAHSLSWEVDCIVDSTVRGKGKGSTKQEAKENAAKNTYFALTGREHLLASVPALPAPFPH